jgi:hypothetical protein
MELYSVGIEYEGMVAIFSTKEKAEAYVAKQEAEEKARWTEKAVATYGNYHSDWYIETVTVDALV